jgi:hypothetical protein
VRGSIWGSLILLAIIAAVALTLMPGSPLPREWNVTKRLYISDPVTLLTPYKLSSAADDEDLCPQVLAAAGVSFEAQPDLVKTAQCGIKSRVVLRGVGASALAPVETRCAVALRLAMWERHGVQPAAKRHLGVGVSKIEHFSSYNCRQIRTTGGNGGRMSLHATAEAIDISGFRLSDGRHVTLTRDYFGQPDRAAFLVDVRNSACQWFETTLGPEYNSLHHDHFHLQSRGWGTCR